MIKNIVAVVTFVQVIATNVHQQQLLLGKVFYL